MTTLREAAEAVMEQLKHGWVCESDPVAQDLRAALAEPQSTHSEECYQWHHRCAVAEVKRLRAELATVPSDCPDSRQPNPPKASAAGHGMAWPGLASSSETNNGLQR